MHASIDPRLPCPFPAGSSAKVAWLRARAAAHLPLWHPQDNSAQAPAPAPKNDKRLRMSLPNRHRLAI